ncbi:TetR/AcrR family transcriptional regulator [Nocardioides sp. JQ2195]|uniref:TetR/AcrR family transcriptional regulator n=1 Tax=Nocardioides sp. JQ2195 TaxID=2592334 RepID=UPI00143E136B|nr:TetR/AcrR family transcriptional regulator [Nocardioides sp. JQ2195]QIX25597.1 TetR/AcrR family transcriptional regulator [Nocardioides sp. JQ2195]
MAKRRTARQVDLLARLAALISAEGFAAFTLDDLAARLSCSKTTLYALAPSKPDLVVTAVKEFFRVATDAVEARVAGEEDPALRVVVYLRAVGAELVPLSRRFMEDLAGFAPASEVYRRNTAYAAARIRTLIADGIAEGALRQVNPDFAAEMIASTMFEIQRGEIFERLELTDAQAYDELAAFVVAALAGP